MPVDETAADLPQLAQISRAVSRVYKEKLGRGPDRVHCHYAGPDAIVCFLEGTLTPLERLLSTIDEHKQLRDIRLVVQDAVRPGDAPLPGTVNREHHAHGLTVVSMRGEHDISTAPELAQALEWAAAHSDVLVDLSECDFIDSTAIGVLIRIAKQVQARGEQLVAVIPGASSNVARLARMVRLAEIMPVKTSHGDALASLERAHPPAWPDPVT